MTQVDYIVIAFYLVFMFALGPVYKSFSKTASDFFRGGGGMLWWVVGASTFMTTFTAWSFTGGAGKAYETGTFFLLIFACNVVGLIFTYFFTAAKFRQMRVITYVEAICKRYGKANEQIFTWLPVPFMVLFGGIGLYAIAIFMSAVFGVEMWAVIVTLGVVVMLMTLFGGSWSATAGDFVQMLVVLVTTIIMTFFVLTHEKIGGINGLVEQLPSRHFNWTEFDRLAVIIFFAVTLLINQAMQGNSMQTGAAKYIFVKNGVDAKKSVLISILGFLLLTPIWVIPAMAATIFHPDLGGEYPGLNNPSEAAYVAMAIDMLPPGMLGLLVCAIFAASITSMNSQLNMVSGIFVRNFYIRLISPKSSEAKQIFVGRVVIFCYGILWIVAGLMFSRLKSMPLFDLILLMAASIGIPTTVPLFFGIFFKRPPTWSAWSTLIVGFSTSIALRFILTAELISKLFNPAVAFNDREIGDMEIALTTGILFLVCTIWYFITTLFGGRCSKYAGQVDEFFEEMHTPINAEQDHIPTYDNDVRQYNVLGNLCLIYGGFIALMMLVPGNNFKGYMCLLTCGGIIGGIGLVLRLIGKHVMKRGSIAEGITKQMHEAAIHGEDIITHPEETP